MFSRRTLLKSGLATSVLGASLPRVFASPGDPTATPILAGLGDSITAQGAWTSGQNSTPAYGFLSYIPVLTEQRVRYLTSMNFGVGQEDSTQIAARVGQVVAARPDICTVMAGNNDVAKKWPTSITKANLTTIYDRMAAAGIKVIAVPALPIPFLPHEASYPQQLRRDLRALRNDWIADLSGWIASQAASRSDFYFADIVPELSDETGGPKPNLYFDGIHPGAVGGWKIATKIAPIIDRLYPAPSKATWTEIDKYDALHNPGGNLVFNGQFLGEGGVLGRGCAGKLARGWTAAASSLPEGVRAVFAKGRMSDGRPCQVVEIDGEYDQSRESFVEMTMIVSPSLVSSGDSLEGTTEVELDDGSQNVFHPELSVASSGGTFSITTVLNAVHDWPAPTGRFSGLYRTQPLAIPADAMATALLIRVYLRNAAEPSRANARLRFASASVAKRS